MHLHFGLFEFFVLVFLLLHFNMYFPVSVFVTELGVRGAVMGVVKLQLEEWICN